jgi:hypothetical protein
MTPLRKSSAGWVTLVRAHSACYIEAETMLQDEALAAAVGRLEAGFGLKVVKWPADLF